MQQCILLHRDRISDYTPCTIGQAEHANAITSVVASQPTSKIELERITTALTYGKLAKGSAMPWPLSSFLEGAGSQFSKYCLFLF